MSEPTSRDLLEIKSANLISPVSATPETDWSDLYFENTYAKALPIFKIPLLPEALLQSKSFLNWYVTNSIQDSAKLGILIYQQCLLMKYSRAFVFSQYFSDSEGAKSMDVIGGSDQIKNISVRFVASTSRSGTSPKLTITDDTGRLTTTVDESIVKDWYEEIYKVLDASTSESTSSNEGLNLIEKNKMEVHQWAVISGLSYLAQTLLRIITKNPEDIELHIAKTCSLRLNGFWREYEWSAIIPPPHAMCYSSLAAPFGRFSRNSKECLALLVSVYVNTTHDSKSDVKGILRATCLLSLSELGLGMISWLIRAAQAVEMEPGELADHLYFESTKNSIKTLLRFYKSVAGQETWPWARCFDEGAWISISTGNNPFITLTCVGLVAGGDMNSPLWNIPQLNRYKDMVNYKLARQFSRDLIAYFNSKKTAATLGSGAGAFMLWKKTHTTSQAIESSRSPTPPLSNGTAEGALNPGNEEISY